MLLLYITLLLPATFAHPCTFTSPVSVDCRHKGLTDIPLTLPGDLRHLDLSSNSIHLSQPLSVKFSELFHLNLSNNPLHILPAGVFRNLPHLQTLDLSTCGISELRPDSLQGLKKLQRLFLSHNHLRTVDVENLGELVKLDLTDTFITSLGFGQPPGRDFLLKLENRGFCDCSSGTHLGGTPEHGVPVSLPGCGSGRPALPEVPMDPGVRTLMPLIAASVTPATWSNHVSGLFCSCKSLREERGLPVQRVSHDFKVRNRFIRDVTEKPDNGTSLNNTSPSPPPVSQGRSWPYLVGFVLIAITLSLLIAAAAKCKVFHQYFRSYRHRPLPENEWAAESQSELPGVPIPHQDDEDGFIEDNYIQPEDHQKEEDEDEVSRDDFYSI